MPTEDSILNGTKKILGIPEDYTVFDYDVLIHINSVFSTLTQIGVGPLTGYRITGPDETWGDFIGDDPRMDTVKTYMFLRVKLLFDPPGTSFHINALNEEIARMEWRMNVDIDPERALQNTEPPEEVILDGGTP